MRLIDADALETELERSGKITLNLMCVIDEQPTVEPPVAHGWWDSYEAHAYIGVDKDGQSKWAERKFYRCSRCRKGTAVQTAYCAYCGTRNLEETP